MDIKKQCVRIWAGCIWLR